MVRSIRSLGAIGLALAVMGVGCGEDEPPPPPPGAPGAAAKPRTATKKKAVKTKALVPKLRVEDLVTEPYERLSIRHQFRDRDFAVEQSNRDPFQSFVLGRQVIATPNDNLPMDITKRCRSEDKFVARNYSYTDLRLVGIVAERTQRKVLMLDSANLGHIIKQGDCVGREKALVKDIGAGYITFQIQPEGPPSATPRAVEEHSVQLYPNQLPVMSSPNPDVDTARPVAPVVGPGAAGSEAPQQPIERSE